MRKKKTPLQLFEQYFRRAFPKEDIVVYVDDKCVFHVWINKSQIKKFYKVYMEAYNKVMAPRKITDISAEFHEIKRRRIK